MIRAFAFVLLVAGLLVPAAASAQEQHEESHVFEANGLEIIHPWARAAVAGEETLVFFELHNDGTSDRLLGAQSEVTEAVHIVGLAIGADGTEVQEVGPIDIPPGVFHFDPGGLALELHGLTLALEQGQHFDLILEFAEAGLVEIEVAVEAAGATQHSHVGHSH